MTHNDYMQQAIFEAQQAVREDEVPVGAVVVSQDGEVLAKAHNRTIALSDPTAHAEILALRSAAQAIGNYRLLNTVLYVTIEPCVMCMGALLLARVSKIVYGTKDPKGGAAGSSFNLAADASLNHVIDVEGGLLENQCRELIQAFFEHKRAQQASQKVAGVDDQKAHWY